jgi:rubrerythrin
MDQGQSTYGISNIEYNLITTMANLLDGVDVLDQYAQDAEQAGDSESATIFRTIRENNKNSAQQLRNALSRQMGKS